MDRMVESYIRWLRSSEQTDWDVSLPNAEFAYNSSILKDIDLSPFEVDPEWKPKAPMNTLFPFLTPLETPSYFRDRLKVVADDANPLIYGHL